jgi:protein involved in polysaccharide export with SLBB domain
MNRFHISSKMGVLGGLLLAIGGIGCTTSGNSVTLFPEGHMMIDAAKDVRVTTPAPLPRELDKHPLEAYIIEPGDGLLILPLELDSPIRIPSDQTVLPDGAIDLGKFGRLEVAGRTVPEIEALVNQAVVAKTNPKPKDDRLVNVRLVTRASKVYYVLGEVNAPGAFPLSGRETVLDGIVAAGGLNGKASRKNIILARPSTPDGCRTVLAICYPAIVQLGDTTTNYQLRPGDRIYVSTRSMWEGCHSRSQPCANCMGPQAACAVPAATLERSAIISATSIPSMPGAYVKDLP